MAIELATPNDEVEIIRLLIACDLPVEDITSKTLEHFFVDRRQNIIIGVVGLEVFSANALLRSLAVSPAHRYQGVASYLVTYVEEFARSKQLLSLHLLTTTAEAFFKQRGYKKKDRDQAPIEIQNTTEFAALCPDNAIYMIKTLSTD